MTRAYDNAADARFQQGGRRNLMINGAMQVWQRGTSVTGATNTGYSTADRWEHNASGGTLNLSRQSLTLGQIDIPQQFKYFYRVECTDGNNNAGIWQSVEDVTRVQGTHTLSFYAKGTNPNQGSFEIEIRQNFGTSGSSSVDITENFTVTSEWQRFSITFTPASISGKTIDDADSYLRVYFRQDDGDTSTDAWTLDITGVQLEQGNVATPFEHRSYGEELALCQRYYVQWTGATGNNYIPIASGVATNTTISDSFALIPVPMRANPSCTYSGNIFGFDGQSGLTLSSVNANYGGDTTIYLNLHYTGGSWTIGRSVITYTQNASTAKFYLDAEL